MASPSVDKMKKNKTPVNNLRRDVPCRVMSKSVDNEEHGFVPRIENYPKFDGVSGCRITTKNKFSGDYRYIYPMLDPDGKIRAVTERDFHCRICYKYRGYVNYQYVYPVLIEDGETDLTKDNLELLDGWDERTKDAFVPEEVERMIPLGIDRVWKSPNTGDIYIVSVRGDIFLARLKTILGKVDEDIPKPKIRTLLEVNGLADVVYTKKTERAMDRWKRQMEKMAAENHCQNRIVYFGNNLDPSEWKDESILDFFAQNYPEEEEDNQDETGKVEVEADGETTPSENGRFSPGKSVDGSLEDEDSGYGERRKASYVSSRLSCDSFNSDEFRNTEESPVPNSQQQQQLQCPDAITTGEDQDEDEEGEHEETLEVTLNKESHSENVAVDNEESKTREEQGDAEDAEDAEEEMEEEFEEEKEQQEEEEEEEEGSSSVSSPSLTTAAPSFSGDEKETVKEEAPLSVTCLPATDYGNYEAPSLSIPDENKDDIEIEAATENLQETETSSGDDLIEKIADNHPKFDSDATRDLEMVTFKDNTIREVDLNSNQPNAILEGDNGVEDDEIRNRSESPMELTEDANSLSHENAAASEHDSEQPDLIVENLNSTPEIDLEDTLNLSITGEEIISKSDPDENEDDSEEKTPEMADQTPENETDIQTELDTTENNPEKMEENTEREENQDARDEIETSPKMDSREEETSLEENNNEKVEKPTFLPFVEDYKPDLSLHPDTTPAEAEGDDSFQECLTTTDGEKFENESNLKSTIAGERDQDKVQDEIDTRRDNVQDQIVTGRNIASSPPNDFVSEDAGASSSEDAFFDSENYFHFPENGGGKIADQRDDLSSNIYETSYRDLDDLEIARPKDSVFPSTRDSPNSPTLAFLCSRIVSDNDTPNVSYEDALTKVRSPIEIMELPL